MRTREDFNLLISRLIEEDIHLYHSHSTLFLVGKDSQLRGKLDNNLLEIGENPDLLITLYPEVSALNSSVVNKVIKTGKSSYWSEGGDSWL